MTSLFMKFNLCAFTNRRKSYLTTKTLLSNTSPLEATNFTVYCPYIKSLTFMLTDVEAWLKGSDFTTIPIILVSWTVPPVMVGAKR